MALNRVWITSQGCGYAAIFPGWLQFTFQLLQDAFIWCLNSTGDGWLLQDAWALRNEVDTERGWIAPPDLCGGSSAHAGACRPVGHSTRRSSHGSRFRKETHTCYFQRSEPDVTLRLKQWWSVTLSHTSSIRPAGLLPHSVRSGNVEQH